MTTSAPDRGAVLITGASSGIGRACAIHLDRLGFRVLAGVRRDADGESLRAKASPRLTPVIIDVADGESITAAAARVDELAPEGLAGLVNNAGIAVTGPLEFIDLDRVRRQFEVNFFGQLAVTQAMLPALRRRRGRIVNMSSMSGRLAAPFYGPYAASKHALEAASDALRGELAPWGIDVVVIEPGAIDTPIWERGMDLARDTVEALPADGRALYEHEIEAGLRSIEEQGQRGIAVEGVAEVVGRALMTPRPRVRYVIGRDAHVGILSRRWLPDALVDRLLWRRLGLPGRGARIE
jgi:NAD(P)-dependent dehydrogenase (short-subunit alcohol dehydrogenase family)